MMRVAYLTSADMVPGGEQPREDLFELELQLAQLTPAFAKRDVDLVLTVWDDPAFTGAGFDAAVVGTTWDYTERAAEFLDKMDSVSARTRVFNPPSVLRWNASKTYLRELANRGAPSIQAVWLDTVTHDGVEAAREQLGGGTVVVKSVVGACAVGQVLSRPGVPLPPSQDCPPGAAFVQPFLPSVASEGEYSAIFCDGSLSHVLRKVPETGDYRTQSVYGAREETAQLTVDEVGLVKNVLAMSPEPTLYARVDLVRGLDGELKVMELELIEPYLYPEQGPRLGETLADAFVRRMRS